MIVGLEDKVVASTPGDSPRRPPAVPGWFRVGARIRGAATLFGLVGMAAGILAVLALPDGWAPDGVVVGVCFAAVAALMVGLGLTFVPGAPAIAARTIGAPVLDRWTAANSPADRVPSHGTHGHGQTFALDLVCDPEGGGRPAFGSGPAFQPQQDFPGFGQPLFAPLHGRVVSVFDGARDHRSRSTNPAVAYMLLEAVVREAAGSKRVFGNHVVIEAGDGSYALLAHLQRGSVAVIRGQRVRRGDLVGRCGSSGNTSEPHVHFQLMDRARPVIAAGLPFRFDGPGGVPRDGEAIVVGADRPRPLPADAVVGRGPTPVSPDQ